jgi:hypothetical protein
MLKLKVLYCIEEGEKSILFKFIIDTPVCKVKIWFEDQAVVTKEIWKHFLEAVKADAKGQIIYCRSNGNVEIHTDNGETIFNVRKSGAGGEGSISVVVKNCDCIDAFEKVIELLK